MATLHFKHYPTEHYFILFNKESGFFVRAEENGYPEPFWSEHGPEMLDVSITNMCSKECSTCYRSSTSIGKHMSLLDYELILRQAAEIGVFQIALGGGNPNEHPFFNDILQLTRFKYGIVPNYTTNGYGLSSDIIRASAKCCGAVAISAYEPFLRLEESIKELLSHKIRTNIHFVLDNDSIKLAFDWLNNPPAFLKGINAIIFLNYKPVGRGASDHRLLKNSKLLDSFINLITLRAHDFKIGFDSCMVSALVDRSQINPVWFDACEASRFTMFVSEDMYMYPCSFMADNVCGIKLDNENLLDAWQNSSLFTSTRKILKEARCDGCAMISTCYGGCPAFPAINLCERKGYIKATRGRS